jgi:putative tricarboxylic transport membrane protein
MDLLHHLALGFETALSLQNLFYAFIGCLLGTLIGVLPGVGPVATIAMLMPSIYHLDATSALIMLAGIYYGAQYGGSTTAILIKVPGEASSVATVIDGHAMALQGRAGPALAVAALGSFFAGTVATLVIAAFAPLLSNLAFEFGSAEYFSLMVLGLIAAVVLASGSLLKAICMVLVGLLLGQVNTDVISGMPRFSFGVPELTDGLSFMAIAMGLFAFGEVIAHAGRPDEERDVLTRKVQGLWLSRQDFKDATPAVLRGTTLGCVLGVLPGGGALLASFAAYTLEKKLARGGGRFGQGDIRGVAAPESANNAGAQTSFIPMLTLGIPPNAVMAMMIGAMTIKGIQPGPQVMLQNPSLFWGLISSMWIGNLMLVVLNLPLIGLWVRLLNVPYAALFPAILTFCCIGLYGVSASTFDVYTAVVFGLFGYLLHLLRCEPAPLMLGFILGPMMEEHLRRTLLLSSGSWSGLLARPLSAGLLALAAVLLLAVALPAWRRRREAAFEQQN